jgi:hypothetical protein
VGCHEGLSRESQAGTLHRAHFARDLQLVADVVEFLAEAAVTSGSADNDPSIAASLGWCALQTVLWRSEHRSRVVHIFVAPAR